MKTNTADVVQTECSYPPKASPLAFLGNPKGRSFKNLQIVANCILYLSSGETRSLEAVLRRNKASTALDAREDLAKLDWRSTMVHLLSYHSSLQTVRPVSSTPVALVYRLLPESLMH